MLRRFAAFCLFCIAATAGGSAFAFEVPPNDGFVTDTAGILSQEDHERLEQMLAEYRAETTNEIAVVIVPTLGGDPLMETAVEIGREWGVGTEANDNGIVLLIAYEDREMFLATGYGLEGAVPDIVAKGIIDREISPLFRDGQYAAGIEAGFRALEKHIGGEYTAERYGNGGEGMPAAGLAFFAFFLLFVVGFLSAFVEGFLLALAPTRSWWAGGVVGLFVGIFFAQSTGWWLAIPAYVVFGFLFDLLFSRLYLRSGRFARWVDRRASRRRRGSRGGWGSGSGGSSGGRTGGSSGSFGGGSFGGGGARGRW